MKLISTFLLGGAVALGLAGAVFAQGAAPMQAARAAMEQACSADIASLCAGKTGRDAGECLNAAGDKVSPGCKDAMSKMGGPGPRGQGGGAPDPAGGPRSPPSLGGAVGIVDSVSPTGFEIKTATGHRLNITTSSSTAYRKGAVATNGSTVRVLGMVGFGAQGMNSTNIAATLVVVQSVSAGGVATAPAASAAPAQRGGPQAAAPRVGQIPADYVEGGGTLVNGTDAIKAAEAALASSFYQGGVINRVVKVNDTTYECHNVLGGPHHIFVNTEFKVVGAY